MYNGYYYGFDMTYLVLVVPALLIALIAQIQVKSAFSRYAGVRCTSGLTGAQAAQRILQANGITDVRIEHISGKLTDHFDPQAKVIRLSDEVYGVASIAAVGVAAHEAGHAVQYATDYAPIRIRAAIIPATRIGSNLSWPLLIAGLMGHARADRPNSMKPCFFLGLATGVIILFNVLYEIFTGDAPNIPEICTYVLDLVLPVLYTFCAWLNWRHMGDDTPKAADAYPAPASKSRSFPLDKKLKHAELSSLRAFFWLVRFLKGGL